MAFLWEPLSWNQCTINSGEWVCLLLTASKGRVSPRGGLSLGSLHVGLLAGGRVSKACGYTAQFVSFINQARSLDTEILIWDTGGGAWATATPPTPAMCAVKTPAVRLWGRRVGHD